MEYGLSKAELENVSQKAIIQELEREVEALSSKKNDEKYT